MRDRMLLALLGLLAATTLGTPCRAQGPPAAREGQHTSETLEQKVFRIANRPGYFDQMCSLVPHRNHAVSFLGFTGGMFKLTPAQYQELRRNRDEVQAIVRDKFKQVVNGENFADGMPIAANSYLLMLIDLNGSEGLEDLISAAERMQGEPAKKNYSGEFYLHILSTILALLYQEQDPAVMKSEYAKTWEAHQRGETTTAGNISGHRLEIPEFELTSVGERQVLGWARDFVKRVPEAKRLRAKGMAKAPVQR